MTTQELQIAKLRYLLYEAIVELEYAQASEDHSLCASAKGREIVERGMKLLEVKDLSQEHLVGAQEENTTVSSLQDVNPALLAEEIIEALHEGTFEQIEFFEEYGIDAEANSAHEFLAQVLTILQRGEGHGKA